MSEDLHDELHEATIGVLIAAVQRDAAAVAAGLERIGAHGGAAMYGSCSAWAEAVTLMVGWRAVIGENADEGMVGLERLPGASEDESDPSLWAARFVAATANKDYDTTLALFTTSYQAGELHHGRCVIALIGLAGSVGRHKAAENRRSGRRDRRRKDRRKRR